jgi:hypothetical protein
VYKLVETIVVEDEETHSLSYVKYTRQKKPNGEKRPSSKLPPKKIGLSK